MKPCAFTISKITLLFITILRFLLDRSDLIIIDELPEVGANVEVSFGDSEDEINDEPAEEIEFVGLENEEAAEENESVHSDDSVDTVIFSGNHVHQNSMTILSQVPDYGYALFIISMPRKSAPAKSEILMH